MPASESWDGSDLREVSVKPLSPLAPRPRLATFRISHFCEKARWALDWHGIGYEEVIWPIGLHLPLAKMEGALGTTVPLLLHRGVVVQGSGAIVDWADANGREPARFLTNDEAYAIERRADRLLGVHVRRLCYAEMLPAMSGTIRTEMLRGTSPVHRALGASMWPVTRRLMMRALDVSPATAADSRSILEGELDWVDGMLEDGRAYLAGDRFSRADIAVASLLAPLARPEQMPVFSALALPAPLLADVERWRCRPSIRFVTRIYRERRLSGARSS